MCVTVEATKCVVQFCNTHIGHKLEEDMRHLFLSKLARENITFNSCKNTIAVN